MSDDVFGTRRPFGGFMQSGLGRERGECGLVNCAEVNTVTAKLL